MIQSYSACVGPDRVSHHWPRPAYCLSIARATQDCEKWLVTPPLEHRPMFCMNATDLTYTNSCQNRRVIKKQIRQDDRDDDFLQNSSSDTRNHSFCGEKRREYSHGSPIDEKNRLMICTCQEDTAMFASAMILT